MKVFKSIIGQVKRLEGKSGLIIRIYIIASFVFISFLIIKPIVNTIYRSSFFQYNAILFYGPINDVYALENIAERLSQENIKLKVTKDGHLLVKNEEIARQMRRIIILENLIPASDREVEPYSFDHNSLTFERGVNFRRTQERLVTDHIRAIDGVYGVKLIIGWPTERLIRIDQEPVTASIIIFPEEGSDIINNRQKIEGIQRLLQFSIDGIYPENIVITDQNGYIINDF